MYKLPIFYSFLGAFILLIAFANVNAQTTSITYQGSLTDSAVPQPTNGTYDIQFKLWDNPSPGQGVQKGSTLSMNGVQVTNGIFAVNLDFGSAVFTTSPNLFLEIAFRASSSQGSYASLSPRMRVSSAPFAIQSLNATTADTAVTAQNATNATNAQNAATATNSAQLGGIPASQYVVTTDTRMTDSRSPLAGSSNYIQNGNSLQASSNFNISGKGSAASFDASTNYSIGGNTVFATPGTANTFGGFNAGLFNTTGSNNSMFGYIAGAANTTGVNNAFFGFQSGNGNTAGSFNSFFGPETGLNNASNANSFFGSAAGRQNITGGNNAFFGADAGRNNNSGGGNAFFGTFAGINNLNGAVNTFVGVNAGLGNTVGSNNTLLGSGANVGANNLTFATAIGSGAVVSASNTLVLGRGTDTVQAPGSFSVGGALSVGGAFSAASLSAATVNATTHFSLNGNRILSNAGTNNLFAGASSGAANTSGNGNAFVGSLAGQNNTSGINNAFFGFNAGNANSGGGANTFVGVSAGNSNVGSSNNTMVGANAGFGNLLGSGNTYVGANSDGGVLVTNSVAVGQKAYAGQSNAVILGSVNGVNGASATMDVGIGTSTPASRLHVVGNTALVGSLGVGTVTPSSKLHVVDTSPTPFTLESSSTSGSGMLFKSTMPSGHSWRMFANDGNNSCCTFHINSSLTGEVMAFGDNLGGTSAGNGYVDVNGDLNVLGVISINSLLGGASTSLCRHPSGYIGSCSSSLRYKKNIGNFTSGLNLIDKLHPITFDWKSDGMHDLGFGAEDVAKVEPLLATYNAKGEVEGVKYDRISAVLVNAVKEQQLQIEEQEKQIKNQNAVNERQEAEIAALRSLVCRSHRSSAVCRAKK